MPAIIMAYEGRVDMLRSVFGGGDAPPEGTKPSMIKQLSAMKKAHDKRTAQ